MAKYKEKKDWDKTSKFPKFNAFAKPGSIEKNIRRKLINLCFGKYILFVKTINMGKCIKVFNEMGPYSTTVFYIECENGIIRFNPQESSFKVDELIIFIDRLDSKEDLYTKKLMYEVTDDWTEMDKFAKRYTWGDYTIKEAADYFGLRYLERK